MIVIVDYGIGNVRSVFFKLAKEGVNVKVSSDIETISRSKKLILLGVGHFGRGMQNLADSGLIEILENKVKIQKTPILGICLGMQLFADYGYEGNCKGLGWIKGKVEKFNFNTKGLKIPHVGWNNINVKKSDPILKGISDGQYFYFTHSYHVNCDTKYIVTETNYGYDFPSIIRKNNIIGAQFHPEKSHKEGFNFLLNFCRD